MTSANQPSMIELLTFKLAEEHYGIDIMKVKEIRGYEAVTKIANAPDFIKGVINLRGDIVPILDLRLKFSVGEATYNEFTIVIMVVVAGKIIGIVVDAVSDVIKLSDADIKPAPEFGVAFDSRYLSGLVTQTDHMVILLNIDALITSEEIGILFKQSQKND